MMPLETRSVRKRKTNTVPPVIILDKTPRRSRNKENNGNRSGGSDSSDSSSDSSVVLITVAIGSHFRLTAPALKAMLEQERGFQASGTMATERFLLIDCRDAKEDTRKWITSANVALLGGRMMSDEVVPVFDSKHDVVSFLLDLGYVDVAVKLKTPGYYTNVIIYDTYSCTNKCSESTKRFIDAMVKWNEGTQTRVKILEKGFAQFSTEFPQFIGNTENLDMETLSEENATTDFTRKMEELLGIAAVEQTTKNLFADLCTHLVNLDTAISVLGMLIKFKGRISGFEAIKSCLHEELHAHVREVMSKCIPEEVVCPVCTEIFSNTIFQCTNGHSFCDRCVPNLKTCPECRVVFDVSVGVRNRAFEKYIQNKVVLPCEKCKKNIPVRQIEEHLTLCFKQEKTIVKVTQLIDRVLPEIKKLNEKYAEVNLSMMKTEQIWNESPLIKTKGSPMGNFTVPLANWKTFTNMMMAKKRLISERTNLIATFTFYSSDN